MRHIVLVVLLMSLCSCVANKPWRLPPNPQDWGNCAEAAKFSVLNEGTAGGKKGYTLAFVEFDDFGELFNRCELTNALQAIDKAKESKSPIIAVIFVHGWKNNASDKTGNVWGFRDALRDVVDNVAPPDSPVIGIYIGWRGAVVNFPLIKEFTFYDRRDTATHVAGAQVTETLMSLMQRVKGNDFAGESRSVLVGHSFGGLLLEHAITQSLVNIMLRDEQGACKDEHGNPAFCAPADLITFVNEAGPALEAKTTLEFLTSHKVALRDGKQPLIVSMTSKGDAATKFLLPAAQFASRPKNSLRTYPNPQDNFGIKSQTSLYIRSTANTAELQTHLIGRSSDPEIQKACLAGREFTNFTINNGKDGYRVVGLAQPANKTAYWAMQIPTEIVPDHSNIFRPEFRELLKAMIVPTPVQNPSQDCATAVPPASRLMAPSMPKQVYQKIR